MTTRSVCIAMTRLIAISTLIAALVAACGVPAQATTPGGTVGPVVAGIPRCVDVPAVEAAAEAYRDTPIYVGNEMPVDEVRAWAVGQPGFEDIWIDRDHHGWITVAFSEEAAARQRDLSARFPDVGVVAVQVDWTTAELEALQRRIHEALPPDVVSASGTLATQGVVMIGVGVLTPERVALVEERFAGQAVCLEGIDPADAPVPGPQQAAGDGWRLLATEPTGQPYRTGIAWDEASLEVLWANAGVSAPIPTVDFETEAVIWFGAVYGGSCPDLRLDDVVIDDARRIVHAEIVLVDPAAACTADANPRAYLVAVDRSRLPAPPFAIQLTAEDPPGGVPEERTLVDADLRAPGSVATAEQVHGDPNLLQPGTNFVESGDTIETGFPADYRMSVHCGVEWLGVLNDVAWRTPVPAGTTDWIPPAWEQVVAMDQSIILTVELSPGPDPTVSATANGQTLVYTPSSDPPPGCDR
jgi:hypothetical protein